MCIQELNLDIKNRAYTCTHTTQNENTIEITFVTFSI